MKDANGREIKVGDVVATPYHYNHPVLIAKAIADAVLGSVVETFVEYPWWDLFKKRGRGFVHIGNGITCAADEIITLGGLEFVTCDCGFPWPFDVRMNTEEECPDCGALLQYRDGKQATRHVGKEPDPAYADYNYVRQQHGLPPLGGTDAVEPYSQGVGWDSPLQVKGVQCEGQDETQD